MTLLFLNSSREWGGNEKWSLAAASGLAARGHRVYFGCRSRIFRERARDAGVTFVTFPLANQADAFSVVLIAAFIRRHCVDVVIPTRQREYLLGGIAALPFRRTRVVARLGIDRPLRTARSRFAFTRLFDGVIVNAQSIVTTLGKTPGFDTTICRVIYNGIQVPVLVPETRHRIRQEFKIDEGNFVIGCAGRCTPQKGFDFAIKAFSQLATAAPEARLVIAGDGPQFDEYRTLSRTLLIADRVVFAGFRSDLLDLLQALDLFWLTSRSEGMPNVLLEAMAAGVPGVAFDVAGVRELVTDRIDGIVVAPGDLGALTRATLDGIGDPERRRAMAEAARKTAAGRFGMERMVAEVERFLQDVSGADRRG